MGFLEIFKKKDAGNVTMPQNDKEKWIVGVYAMWSEYAEGDWHYFAGSKEKSRQEGASMRVMLRRDWEIAGREGLLDMVSYLTAFYAEGNLEDEDVAVGGWNLCRACQLLGMGFVGGYIDREEMIQKSSEIGQIIQGIYHSWTELCDSYMKGYKEWRCEQDDNWQEDVAEREKLYFKLKNDSEGPYSIAWDVTLQ